MPTPAEWAATCADAGHRARSVGGLLCAACAESYARQQVEAALERDEVLYQAALAFCHSIEAKLSHARASQKEVALEDAVRAAAVIRAVKGTL